MEKKLNIYKGIGDFSSFYSVKPGDYIFGSEEGEALKICANGDFFVKGKLVENDREVYLAFKEFMDKAKNGKG